MNIILFSKPNISFKIIYNLDVNLVYDFETYLFQANLRIIDSYYYCHYWSLAWIKLNCNELNIWYVCWLFSFFFFFANLHHTKTINQINWHRCLWPSISRTNYNWCSCVFVYRIIAITNRYDSNWNAPSL